MPWKISSLTIVLVLWLAGCGDDAVTRLQDPQLPEHPPRCLRLDVLQTDPELARAMRKLYPFQEDCPYRLVLSTKSGIVCNSNANAPRKTLSNFPSAYLRLEIYRGMDLLYSYYRDLTHAPDREDLGLALDRTMRETGMKSPER